MRELAIQIVRCVNDKHQPGWVEGEFIDVEGRRHTLVDKVPIFSAAPLDSNSQYPQMGRVACEVLNIWHDQLQRELVRITIDRPYHVESTDKLSEFVVLATQLSEIL